MKNKASGILKQIMSVLTSMGKGIKTKTRAIKTRLIVFSLVRNRKILVSDISHKLNSLINQKAKQDNHLQEEENDQEQDVASALMIYDHHSIIQSPVHVLSVTGNEDVEAKDETYYDVDDDSDNNNNNNNDDNNDDDYEEEKYPDLTHSLFELEDVSVIDIVKNSMEDKGEEFKLEDEIDRVADLFIKRFHRQMWMQKQLCTP